MVQKNIVSLRRALGMFSPVAFFLNMETNSIYHTIRGCVSDEMAEFERLFEGVLHTRVPLADSVIRYFLERTGKRMRPIMTLLSAKMLGEVNAVTINGAAALELLHNASLMHDDIIDKSDLRRGAETINKIWDNRVAVLMGDFFLSKCLSCSNATGSLEISNVLADMVAQLVEGELEQIANIRSRMLSEEAYFSVIRGKTASLFAACMKVGALSVRANEADVEKLARIGELMGLVFQIRDDIFDYYPSTEVGKPTGHDILEGKVTLPLLYALQQAPKQDAQRMRDILDQPGELTKEQIGQLVQFAKDLGGIEYAQARMKNIAFEAAQLLCSFPKNESQKALLALLDYFMGRNH